MNMSVIQFLLSTLIFVRVWGIYGGEETTIDQYPHTVHIRHFNRSICGGAIISRSYVLTAAHCTDELSAKYMTVRAGSNSKEEGGQLIQVLEIIQHPKYNGLIKDNDISILKLAHPLAFGRNVKAISLENEGADISAGTRAVISGWGKAKAKATHTLSTLQKVEVDVINLQDCKDHYKDNPVTDHMFCATSDGKDSCKGDSGGPLIANNKLIGLVSWGRSCGKAKYPGVYTKISSLRSWIDTNTTN